MPLARALPLSFVLVAACATEPARRGPLPLRNQHPAQLTVLHMDPAPAASIAPGVVEARLTSAYSSLFLFGTGHGNQFEMDGELLRSSVQVATGIGSGVSIGAELPAELTTGGFLDGFLIGYHELFGFPDQGRDAGPRDRFAVAADWQGQRVFEQQASPLQLADVPLTLTWTAWEPRADRPGLALRGGVELPTGCERRGKGNGGTDWAIGTLVEWPFDWGTCYAHAQHTFAATPSAARDAGFEFADVTSLGGGIDLPLLDDLDAVVQTEWETSTLRQLDFPRAAGDQLLLWTGGRLRLDRDLFLEVSVGEDLLSFVSPDVTFWFALAWLPGRGRPAGTAGRN